MNKTFKGGLSFCLLVKSGVNAYSAQPIRQSQLHLKLVVVHTLMQCHHNLCNCQCENLTAHVEWKSIILQWVTQSCEL